MKTLKTILVALVALSMIACDRSAVSRVPSEAEIEEAKERRLANIETLNIPEEQKEMMRQQIRNDEQRPGGGDQTR